MAVAADKDVPRLSLSLDYPQGTSPFPSPSSAFLPPPVHSVHEAWSLPAGRFAKERQQLRRDSESSHTSSTHSDLPNTTTTDTSMASTTMNRSLPATSSATTNGKGTPKMNGDVPSTPSTPHALPSASATPTLATHPNPITNPGNTGTTTSANRISLTPNVPPNISTSKPISIPYRTPTSSSTTTPTTIAFSTSGTGSSPGLNSSLLSTRPAPPSPAPSRRTSTVINGIGATSLSRTPSSRRTSALSPTINGGFAPAPPLGLSTSLSQSLSYLEPAKPPARRRLPIVKVIDFGFTDPEDERRHGWGPDTPRANARHKKRDSMMSTISVSTAGSESSDEGVDDDDDEGSGGWGGWSFGFGANGAKGMGMGMPVKSTEWGGPSQGDLMRGFTGFESDEDEDSEMMGEEEGMYEGEGGGECVPGIYKALYAFEPEGPAEMRLVEEQMVKVIGRGGGVGWAVALRDDAEGGGQALVPEDYLELVTPDPSLGWVETVSGAGGIEVGNESIESVEEGEEEDGSPLMVDNVFPTPTSASAKDSAKEQEQVTPTAPEGHHMTPKAGITNGTAK